MRAVVLMAFFWGSLIAIPYLYLPYLLRPLYQCMVVVFLELSRRIGRLSETLGRRVIDLVSQCSYGANLKPQWSVAVRSFLRPRMTTN